MGWRRPARVMAAIGALFAALASVSAHAAPACAGLKGTALAGGAVTSAVSINALPEADLLPSHGPIHSKVDPVQLDLPQFCRVFATLSPIAGSKIVIELWLPDAWNGKLLAIGNHGFSGEFEHGDMAMGLHRGYAVVTTDAGHPGDYSPQGGFSVGSAKFAVGDDVAVDDFAWRAVHEMTLAAKALVLKAYGARARRAYFDGCSNGGREAMREAQQFPRDYDGIIAGSAAMYWTRFMASDLWAYRSGDLGGGLRMTSAKLALAQRAATAACDRLDGIADGLIANVRQCGWKPAALRCKPGQDAASCLTDAEVVAVARMEEPLRDPASGAVLYDGYAPGSEALWISPLGNMNAPNIVTENYYHYMIAGGKSWSPDTIDLFAAMRADERPGAQGARIDSIDPDLSAFRAAGGKLLQYHGWRDEAMASGSAPRYYMQVVDLQTGTDRLKRTQDFYRLFMVPGMQHCYGGNGPVNFGGLGQQPSTVDADHDLLEALDLWVERGRSPDRVIATTYDLPDVPKRQMPLCPFPQVAMYDRGDPARADSFACRTPAAAAR